MWTRSSEDSFARYITNKLSDVFTDSKKCVKSQILVANTLTQIEVLEGQLIDIQVNESKSRLKRGRSISAKDKNTLEEQNTRKASRSLWRGNTLKTGNINNWFI